MIKNYKFMSFNKIFICIFTLGSHFLYSQNVRKDYTELKMVYDVDNKTMEKQLNVAVEVKTKIINLTLKQAEKNARSYFRGETPLPAEIKMQLYKIASDSRTSEENKIAALRAAGKIDSDNRNSLNNLIEVEYGKLLKTNNNNIDYEISAFIGNINEIMPKNKLAQLVSDRKVIIDEHLLYREIPIALGLFKGFKLNNNLVDNPPSIKMIKLNQFPIELKFNLKNKNNEKDLAKMISKEIPNMIELSKNKIINETYVYNLNEKIDYGYYLIKINDDLRMIYITPQEKIAIFEIPEDQYLYIAGLWVENLNMGLAIGGPAGERYKKITEFRNEMQNIGKIELLFDRNGKINNIKLFDKNGTTPPKIQYIDEKINVEKLTNRLMESKLVGPYKEINNVDNFKKSIDYSMIQVEQYQNENYAQSGNIKVENLPVPRRGYKVEFQYADQALQGLSKPGKINVKGTMNVGANGFGKLNPSEFRFSIISGNGSNVIIENLLNKLMLIFKPATAGGVSVSSLINIDFTIENRVIDFHGMTKDEVWMIINDIKAK